MHNRLPLKLIVLALTANIILTACTLVTPEADVAGAQAPASIPPIATEVPQEAAADTDASASKRATDTEDAAPAAAPLEEPTIIPVEEPTATAEPTVTPEPTVTLAPTATLEPTSTPVSTATPVPQASTATVLSSRLNMRAGPSTNYLILSVAERGREFNIIGQVNNCGWLQIEDANVGIAWIAGTAQYVSFTVPCTSIPAATIPPTAVPPTPVPAPTQPPAAQPPPTPPPAPTAPPAPTTPPANDPFPADEGCYLFQNQLGPEVTVTLTAQDWQWSDTFRLANGEEHPYCLGPGRYTYTIDAPPPWDELNGELKVNAGDRLFFPIRARN